MAMRRLCLLLSVIVLAATPACGDDDDDESVSAEDFAAAVNTLCEEEHERVDAMFTDFPEEPTPADVQALIADFAESFEEYRDGLVAVGSPEGREETSEEYIEAVNAHLERLEAGAVDEDKAMELFNEEGDDTLAELETALGLDTCASR